MIFLHTFFHSNISTQFFLCSDLVPLVVSANILFLRCVDNQDESLVTCCADWVVAKRWPDCHRGCKWPPANNTGLSTGKRRSPKQNSSRCLLRYSVRQTSNWRLTIQSEYDVIPPIYFGSQCSVWILIMVFLKGTSLFHHYGIPSWHQLRQALWCSIMAPA